MRSLVILIGQPLSSSARLITACNTASGVDIIPPQRVTRANCKDPDHLKRSISKVKGLLWFFSGYRNISSFSTRSKTFDIVGLFRRRTRTNSLK